MIRAFAVCNLEFCIGNGADSDAFSLAFMSLIILWAEVLADMEMLGFVSLEHLCIC